MRLKVSYITLKQY